MATSLAVLSHALQSLPRPDSNTTVASPPPASTISMARPETSATCGVRRVPQPVSAAKVRSAPALARMRTRDEIWIDGVFICVLLALALGFRLRDTPTLREPRFGGL